MRISLLCNDDSHVLEGVNVSAPSLVVGLQGGIQQQLKAATPLVSQLLRGLGGGGSPEKTVLNEEDAVVQWETDQVGRRNGKGCQKKSTVIREQQGPPEEEHYKQRGTKSTIRRAQ